MNSSCSKNSKNCILNHEIVDSKYEIPFYSFQNKIFKEVQKVNYNRYEMVNVNPNEIDYIMSILNTQIAESKKATDDMINNLCDYSVQIAGVYDRVSKTKKIYLNLECGFVDYEYVNADVDFDNNDDGTSPRFNFVYDGGDCYFQVEINTKTDKLKILIVNGEA